MPEIMSTAPFSNYETWVTNMCLKASKAKFSPLLSQEGLAREIEIVTTVRAERRPRNTLQAHYINVCLCRVRWEEIAKHIQAGFKEPTP